MKALRSDGMNVSGPPHTSTGGVISQPWASVTTVCTATACSIDAAMSALSAFLATRFCMSVLQNTPQRDAMGYTCTARAARPSSSPTLTPRSTAIWSMKAPVPPAQLPFMRRSAARPSRKNTTLASSPPMSIIDDVSGYDFCTAFVAATTSWTNG